MNAPISNRLTEILQQHGASVRLYARQWCRHPDDALQDALIDLNNLTIFPDDPVAWLYLTVKRRAINQARSESRRRNHQTQAASERETWFEVDPGSEIETAEAISKLQTSLATMPDLEREIVTARIWGELTFEQIATLVVKPSSTVHRIYQRALQSLQQSFQLPQSQLPKSIEQ